MQVFSGSPGVCLCSWLPCKVNGGWADKWKRQIFRGWLSRHSSRWLGSTKSSSSVMAKQCKPCFFRLLEFLQTAAWVIWRYWVLLGICNSLGSEIWIELFIMLVLASSFCICYYQVDLSFKINYLDCMIFFSFMIRNMSLSPKLSQFSSFNSI